MRKKELISTTDDFVVKRISREDLVKALSLIGHLLKIARQNSGDKLAYNHYDKGGDMLLSTLLNLLHKYNVSPDEFFGELEESQRHFT